MNLSLILVSISLYISKTICEDVCQKRECVTKCRESGYSLADNCPTCHCNQRKDCPPVRCVITCEFGRKEDVDGCEYCRCHDPCTEGIYKKKCSNKHYCKADFDCKRDHCKIRTRCLKFGNAGGFTTASESEFKPSVKDRQPGQPGQVGPDNDRTRGLPAIPPSPIPAPTRPTISEVCKCANKKTCECTTLEEEPKKTTFEKKTFYTADATPDISTQEKESSGNVLLSRPDPNSHFPTYIYASLASVLGASIIGIVFLTIILYRRRYPKEIDVQEEELTKERESVTSSEAEPQKDLNAANLATQV